MNDILREVEAWDDLIASMPAPPMSRDALVIRCYARRAAGTARAEILALDPSGWTLAWVEETGWWSFLHPDSPAEWCSHGLPQDRTGFSIRSNYNGSVPADLILAEFCKRYDIDLDNVEEIG